MFDFSQIFTLQNAVIYLIVINVIGFGIMFVDKWKAKKRKLAY